MSSLIFKDFASDHLLSHYYGNRITEVENFYLITLDIPGVKKEEIDITLTGKKLNVRARRATTNSTYFESYLLPQNSDNVQAKLEDGVLTITIPKQEKDLPRRIAVT